MLRAQDTFPFPHRVNEDYCASVITHRNRRVRSTHIVTIDKKASFRVCEKCSMPYIGMRNTVVEKIKGEAS